MLTDGNLPEGTGLVVESGGTVVEGYLVVVVGRAAHELLQLVEHGLLARQQILLVAAAVVEQVEVQRLVDECQCLFLIVER